MKPITIKKNKLSYGYAPDEDYVKAVLGRWNTKTIMIKVIKGCCPYHHAISTIGHILSLKLKLYGRAL